MTIISVIGKEFEEGECSHSTGTRVPIVDVARINPRDRYYKYPLFDRFRAAQIKYYVFLVVSCELKRGC